MRLRFGHAPEGRMQFGEHFGREFPAAAACRTMIWTPRPRISGCRPKHRRYVQTTNVIESSFNSKTATPRIEPGARTRSAGHRLDTKKADNARIVA